MEALRKKSGNRPRWNDTKTGSENLLKKYKKRLDELNFSCITGVEIGVTINKNMKTNTIKTLIKSAVFAVAFAGVAQAATSDQTLSGNVTSGAGATFTFNQFDTRLGTLSAIQLIINSSTPGGSFDLSRFNSGGNTLGYLQGFSEQLAVNDDSITDIFNGPVQNISFSGNTTIGKNMGTRTYTVNSSQSLLSGGAYTASIAGGSWSYYTGNATVDIYAAITPATTLSSNALGIGSSYAGLLAASSFTLRYTYTAAPSGVPEPRQVAASLLVLVGIGGYAFMKRKKTPVAV